MKDKCKWIIFPLLFLLIFSCAPSTGVGKFPVLKITDRSQADLAILYVRGGVENKIKQRLINNMDLDLIRDSFRSLKFLSEDLNEQLGIPSTGQLGSDQLEKLAERVKTRYLLDISVEEFGEEQFTDRERETLYYYRTRMQQKSYNDENNGSEDSSDTSPESSGRRVEPIDEEEENLDEHERQIYERIYGREEVPVTIDRIRIVMLVSARIYDLREKRVIWNGRRLDRAEGDLARTSPIELTERVLRRLGGHLSRAILGKN